MVRHRLIQRFKPSLCRKKLDQEEKPVRHRSISNNAVIDVDDECTQSMRREKGTGYLSYASM